MIGHVQNKTLLMLQQAASRLARAARLPSVVVEDVDTSLDRPEPSGSDMGLESPALPQSRPSTGKLLKRRADDPDLHAPSTPSTPGSTSDMNASLDILAEQMLTLVEIVSAQEKDIKALKEQCRRLEEHDQAIMVAFMTFFHILAAKRVAKHEEIAAILQHITRIAEQEERPQGSIKFLQDLAAMLPKDR